jgi:hypothetical protein
MPADRAWRNATLVKVHDLPLCHTERDDIAHILVCPHIAAVRDWTDEILCALGLRRTVLTELLPLGYSGTDASDAAVAEAVRGAAAMAVRAARAHLLMNHTAMNNHNTAVVDIAKRELRQHIAMDWLHCQGKVEPQPGRLAHRGTRPATAGDFRARWRNVCAVSDSVLVVTYKRLVLPGRTDLDD